jgi:hypothetical protein
MHWEVASAPAMLHSVFLNQHEAASTLCSTAKQQQQCTSALQGNNADTCIVCDKAILHFLYQAHIHVQMAFTMLVASMPTHYPRLYNRSAANCKGYFEDASDLLPLLASVTDSAAAAAAYCSCHHLQLTHS